MGVKKKGQPDVEPLHQVLTGSLSPGDQGLANIADVEHSRCLDIIPVLLGERIHTAKRDSTINIHSRRYKKYTTFFFRFQHHSSQGDARICKANVSLLALLQQKDSHVPTNVEFNSSTRNFKHMARSDIMVQVVQNIQCKAEMWST